jgi:isopentenyl diphosphate isomerase/L-lactate dehydrogenase-like FMN-dependent dehydrogenase
MTNLIANVEDARALAKRRIPKIFFDYIDGAAFGEKTAKANIEDFDEWLLEQRVLRNVDKRDLSTTFLGARRPVPFMLGPVGFSGLFAPRGEILAAQAAHSAGIAFCLSNFGLTALEDLRAATPGPLWFQLYVLRRREISEKFLERAERARCEAVAITVDTAVGGIRERDNRNGFRSATRLTPKIIAGLLRHPMWCARIAIGGNLRIGNLADYPEYGRRVLEQSVLRGREIDPSLTWEDLRWVQSTWKGKLVIKGVLNADDARCAVDVGADGVIVSNHGGRQLDCASSTISVLPEIASAVGSQIDILLDGGIRRGAQIVKALALGAKGVLLGRAYAYGLGADGRRGVSQVINVLKAELDSSIGHMGLTSVDELRREGPTTLRHRLQGRLRPDPRPNFDVPRAKPTDLGAGR